MRHGKRGDRVGPGQSNPVTRTAFFPGAERFPAPLTRSLNEKLQTLPSSFSLSHRTAKVYNGLRNAYCLWVTGDIRAHLCNTKAAVNLFFYICCQT